MLNKKRIAVISITLLATTLQMNPASARTLRRSNPTRHAAQAQLSWDTVKEAVGVCESGGRYEARNRHSTASGKYQFLKSTWAGRYGVKQAYLATPQQQEQAAAELHARSGLRPWRASQRCWSRRIPG